MTILLIVFVLFRQPLLQLALPSFLELLLSEVTTMDILFSVFS